MPISSRAGVNGGDGGSTGGRILKRGTKRDASDLNLSDISHFEKRLRLLSLQQNEEDRRNLYTPVPAGSNSNGFSHANDVQSHGDTDLMHVDDTRDRVYVHDLDAELAEIEDESPKEKLVFLPDIEKHFSKLPQQVIAEAIQDGNRELVLYGLPKSLSVDEGHDSVRKAILESRHRARERLVETAKEADLERNNDQVRHAGSSATSDSYSPTYAEAQPEQDADAMDIG